jgi:putative redox protein
MKTDLVTLHFGNTFTGSAESPTGRVIIGDQPDGMMPYHLFYGAIGSCFYATFLSVANKKKLTFDRAKIDITGVKRDKIPATLEAVHIKFIITNPSDKAQLAEASELGAKFCSIHETVSKVAEVTMDVLFD